MDFWKKCERKESEIYYLAQLAVIGDNHLSDETKLEILKKLMENEKTAKYVEKMQAEKGTAVQQDERVS